MDNNNALLNDLAREVAKLRDAVAGLESDVAELQREVRALKTDLENGAYDKPE